MKNLIVFVAALSACVCAKSDVVVSGPVTNNGGAFPVTVTGQVKGAPQIWADTAAMSNAPSWLRATGQVHYVLSSGRSYRLVGGTNNASFVAVPIVAGTNVNDASYYGAQPNDGTDQTELLQTLLDSGPGRKTVTLPGTYLVFNQGANPLQVGRNYCLMLRSNDVAFDIGPGVTIKLANNQQTDATGPVDIISIGDITNSTVGGFGIIIGNTAGQTNFSGPYSQETSMCLINGLATHCENIEVRDLTLEDCFSNPVNIRNCDGGMMRNLRADKVGEIFQWVRSTNVAIIDCICENSTGTLVGDANEFAACEYFLFRGGQGRRDTGSHGGSFVDTYGSRHGVVSDFVAKWQGGFESGTSTDPFVSDDISFGPGTIEGQSGITMITVFEGRNITYHNINFLNSSVVFYVPRTVSANAHIAIKNCNFISNGVSIYIEGKGTYDIEGNVFQGGSSTAALLLHPSAAGGLTVNLKNNRFINNSVWPILIDGQSTNSTVLGEDVGNTFNGNGQADRGEVNGGHWARTNRMSGDLVVTDGLIRGLHGRIGIGTQATNSAADLEIAAQHPQIYLYGSDWTNGLALTIDVTQHGISGGNYSTFNYETGHGVSFAEHGAAKFQVSPGGHVGIGTLDDPEAKLEIVTATDTAAVRLSWENDPTVYQELIPSFSSTPQYSSLSLNLWSNNVSRFLARFQADGKIGVLTTNPVTSLEIAGTAEAPSAGSVSGALSILRPDNNAGLFVGVNARSNSWLQTFAHGNYDHLLLQPKGGFAGVGTTNPGTIFEVKGQTEIPAMGIGQTPIGSLGLRGDTAYGMFVGINADGYGWVQVQRTDGTTNAVGSLLLQPNGGDAPNNGYIGIGKTNPVRKLDVTGDFKVTTPLAGETEVALFQNTSASGYTSVGIDRKTTANYALLKFMTDGTANWFVGTPYGASSPSEFVIGPTYQLADANITITPGGNVGIGTNAPTDKLTVNGTMWVGGAISATAFNVRSRGPTNDADVLEIVASIKFKNDGSVDHTKVSPKAWGIKTDSIPTGRTLTNTVVKFVKGIRRTTKDVVKEMKVVETRDSSQLDLSMLVLSQARYIQILQEQNQQIVKRLDKLEKK